MKHELFTYIRVSTLKQGEYGVSLSEQRETIQRYAQEYHLPVSMAFEDRETAATPGRPAFNRMMRDLHAGRAPGVIFYKVDRSSRNSSDWSKIEELADLGLEVHFAQERLRLSRKGDRLTAGIKAVVAADESRTIRERVTFGFYGRCKEGLLPRAAPLGYLNNGGGQVKTVDPVTGPMVRTLFELYATGRFSLRALGREAQRLGIRSRKGNLLRRTQLAAILHNPFYAGVIRVQKTRQSFSGIHEPLVSSSTFERVQRLLDGKAPRQALVHDFLFRRLLICAYCSRHLIGERQKGRVYYRCHVPKCPTTTVREDVAEEHLRALLQSLCFSGAGLAELKREIVAQQQAVALRAREWEQARQLRLANITAREKRLTDAYIDGTVDKGDFDQRKTALLIERRDWEHTPTEGHASETAKELQQILELANHADLLYESALAHERRELIEALTSNRVVEGRIPRFTLSAPFSELAVLAEKQNGGPSWSTARTRATLRRSVKSLLLRLSEASTRTVVDRLRQFQGRTGEREVRWAA